MASPNPLTEIAGVEPTYSAREAAALLGRSFSWLDQRLRRGEFVRLEGTTVQPLRTTGGYRRLTLAMMRDIATSSYRQGWFSMNELKSAIRELVVAAHQATGDYEIAD